MHRIREAGEAKLMRARYYGQGSTLRFASADPSPGSIRMANVQTWNRYAYVLGNPLKLVDPSGTTWIVSGSGPALDLLTEQILRQSGLKASISEKGVLTVSRTDAKLTPEQEVLAKFLEGLTGAAGEVRTEIVTSGFPKLDNFSKGKLDVGDIARAPAAYSGERSVTGGELFAHSIGELEAVAKGFASDYAAAHQIAIDVENRYRSAAGRSLFWGRISDPAGWDPDGPIHFVRKDAWFFTISVSLRIKDWDVVPGQ